MSGNRLPKHIAYLIDIYNIICRAHKPLLYHVSVAGMTVIDEVLLLFAAFAVILQRLRNCHVMEFPA